ncbi:MAG: hypothetical protein M1831_000330 [Alyxoria varia]|nr:MAG: hypothetical protein M1831_000330 [Alyxoria varia]
MSIAKHAVLATSAAASSLLLLVLYICIAPGHNLLSISDLRRRDAPVQPRHEDPQALVRQQKNDKAMEDASPLRSNNVNPDDDMLPIINAEFVKNADIINDSYIVTWIAPENFASIFASQAKIDAWSTNFTMMLDQQSKRLGIPPVSASEQFRAMPLLPGYSGIFDESTISKIRTDKANVRMVEQDCVLETYAESNGGDNKAHGASGIYLDHAGGVLGKASKAGRTEDERKPRERRSEKEPMRGKRLQKRTFSPVRSPALTWNLPHLSQWDHPLIEATREAAGFPGGYAHMRHAGQGVRAYVLDTGIMSTHRDFQDGDKSRVESVFPRIEPDSTVQGNRDRAGHGTRVAGILGGSSVGVAPNVTLVGVLNSGNVNAAGYTLKSVIDAAERILWDVTYEHPETRTRGAVLNISGGSPWRSESYEKVIDNLHLNGVLAVAASSNQGQDEKPVYPCGYQSVVCVGSVDHLEGRAEGSDYGDSIDIVAPGAVVYTTVLPYAEPLLSTPSHTVWREYGQVSGTSYAAPHVSGIVATILSYQSWKRYDYTPQQIADYARKILFANAQDLGLEDFGEVLVAKNGVDHPDRDPSLPFYIPPNLETWKDELGRVDRAELHPPGLTPPRTPDRLNRPPLTPGIVLV